MQVVVEEVNGLTRKMTVTLPEEDVRKKLNKAYDTLKKEVKMKGFRRGKVPRSIIEKSYKQQVEGEVGEKLIQDTYFNAVEQEKIEPVVHPEIHEVAYNDNGAFTYVAMVDIKPEFEVTGYKGLTVTKPDTSIAEVEVDEELEEMRKEMAALRSVTDREIMKGDVVIVDFQGFHKGHPMKQIKNENYSVDVGTGQMGGEFEEKLIGMKKDEEAAHEVEFPSTHANPILAGKTVEFKINVKDVKERVLSELDDEFAKDVSQEFKSLKELRESIQTTMEQQKEDASKGQLTDALMQELLEGNQFDVPERLVHFEIEEMIKQTVKSLEQNGMTLESAGLNRDGLAETNRPVAEKRVRGDFILKKIAELEDIKVKDEDLDRGFKRIGEQYNMEVAQVKDYFQSRDDMMPFMNELLNEKILNFLKEEADLKEPEEAEADDTEKEPETSEE